MTVQLNPEIYTQMKTRKSTKRERSLTCEFNFYRLDSECSTDINGLWINLRSLLLLFSKSFQGRLLLDVGCYEV